MSEDNTAGADRGTEGGGRNSAAHTSAEQQAWRAELAQQWRRAVSTTAYIPMSRTEIERYLDMLIGDMLAAIETSDDDPAHAVGAGERLVEAHIIGERSLQRSSELLGQHLRNAPSLRSTPKLEQRIFGALGAMASGYANAMREETFRQQENIKRALLRSKLRAEKELSVSEARFQEMFNSTAVGIAISDLNGNFVDVNGALASMLGYSVSELFELTVPELFHPDNAERLEADYQLVVEGEKERFRERGMLVRKDGEPVRTYLAVSLLRDIDGAPNYHVTMVEDISDLANLQELFEHQSLHDQLTQLPNRRFFIQRLERALTKFDANTRMRLYVLDLDGFKLVNDGMGHHVGDQLLRVVGKRLQYLVDGEEALVARFGGDEFAILILESDTTPDMASFASRINEELSEPIYLEGHGIAATAAIGVVAEPIGGIDPAEMLRAADSALRRSRMSGPGQWSIYDDDLATQDRENAKHVAIMPGALEEGRFDVGYKPVVDLADLRPRGIEVQVEWEPEENQFVDHDECMALAEHSGITLPLRDMLLTTACRDENDWRSAGVDVSVALSLTPYQAQDPDLIGVVRGALESADVPPSGLRVYMPSSVVVSSEDAQDNVITLDALGVKTGIYQFQSTPAEIDALYELPVHGVWVAQDIIDRVGTAPDEQAPVARAVAAVQPVISETGQWVGAKGISTEAQASWWHGIGCRFGQGDYLATRTTADEVVSLFQRTETQLQE